MKKCNLVKPHVYN